VHSSCSYVSSFHVIVHNAWSYSLELDPSRAAPIHINVWLTDREEVEEKHLLGSELLAFQSHVALPYAAFLGIHDKSSR